MSGDLRNGRDRGLLATTVRFVNSRSFVAFLLCLPLLVLIFGLIGYPLLSAVILSLFDRNETKFVGLGNFFYLATRQSFWMVFEQTVIFSCSAVAVKALLGFAGASLLNNLPNRGQKIWRGLLLAPWVIPPSIGTLSWWWMYDSTHGALNAIVTGIGGEKIPFLSDVLWARVSLVVVDVWHGTPFFLIMFLAALKSVPAELHEAAKIDGANGLQRLIHVTLPTMRNVIAVTMLFSIIVTLSQFDIVQILTGGGPRNLTHLLGSYAFSIGIAGGDVPLGSAVSLFMVPLLALFAFFILRDVQRRSRSMR
jgi:multiple sugar transport system permease protein